MHNSLLARCSVSVMALVSKAAEWFLKAADQGHDIAQYSLSFLDQHGIGVPLDSSRALEWHSRAADEGMPTPYSAMVYSHGKEVPQDNTKAVGCYLKLLTRDTQQLRITPVICLLTATECLRILSRPQNGISCRPTKDMPLHRITWEKNVSAWQGFTQGLP